MLQMDLFLCSTSFLALMISFSAIKTSKGSPKVIDARGQSISRGVHNGIAFANFKAHKFSYLNITSLGTDYVLNGEECGSACVNIPSCFSFNLAAFYDINGRILCELLPSDKYNNSDKFISSQLFHHFSIGSPCMSGPCQNSGTCVSLYEKNSYVCLCTKGHTGSNCQTDIDDCASHPCKNNGTCTDRVNGFNCSCAPGFNGTQCETDIDDCASHPCKNNGTCTDRVNGFNCSCAPGFNGTQCETDIDECAAQVNPCDAVANSECKNTDGSFNCQCKDGFVRNGPNCEADVCQDYQNLTDTERKYDYVTVNPKCDDTLHDWYRFQGAAGTKMVTTCPSMNRCDATFPAWLSAGHPTVAEGKVTRKVCIRKFGECCDNFVSIQVKNCGSYYIYKLINPGVCHVRYCSTD